MSKKTIVLILFFSFQNAAFLEMEGLDVTDAVIRSLSEAGLDNSPTAKKVMIQSSSSAVLKVFKEKTSYKLVYSIDELVEDVLNSTIQNIKSFADAVVLQKGSVYPSYAKYLTGETQIIQKFHAYNLPVYVKLFENEFVSQAWDFMSDSRMEINTFVNAAHADGIVTRFPKTVAAYTSKSHHRMLCTFDAFLDEQLHKMCTWFFPQETNVWALRTIILRCTCDR